MIPLYRFIIIFLLLTFITACQNNQNDDLIKDAEYLFNVINNEITSNERLTEYDHDRIDKFKQRYINNYEKYESDRNLLLSMEKLINSYQLYYVAIGQGTEEDVDFYQKKLETALFDLDRVFINP